MQDVQRRLFFPGTHCSQVVAFSRERSGVGGKKSKEDVISDFQGAHKVVFGDVQVRGHLLHPGHRSPHLTPPLSVSLVTKDMESLRNTAFADKVDVVVSCLASRTGGVKVQQALHATFPMDPI